MNQKILYEFEYDIIDLKSGLDQGHQNAQIAHNHPINK